MIAKISNLEGKFEIFSQKENKNSEMKIKLEDPSRMSSI